MSSGSASSVTPKELVPADSGNSVHIRRGHTCNFLVDAVPISISRPAEDLMLLVENPITPCTAGRSSKRKDKSGRWQLQRLGRGTEAILELLSCSWGAMVSSKGLLPYQA